MSDTLYWHTLPLKVYFDDQYVLNMPHIILNHTTGQYNHAVTD